jgi:integrase
MLNCGMYAGDISDLKPSEVDWKLGRICRKRSKTKQIESCPTVDYPLWSRTFDLLRTYGRQDGERVFLNRNGNPLVQQCFKGNGKAKNQDSIYDVYRRLSGGKGGKPLKALRKTGASLLDSHDVYLHCVEHYLAHAAKSVTDRSYRNYSQERFDSAIKWLGSQFGL